MSKPEKARVTHFLAGETVQIFGENFNRTCKIYWCRPHKEKLISKIMGSAFAVFHRLILEQIESR